MLDTPTGFGKTTAVVKLIRRFLAGDPSFVGIKRVFFVTNLITNLPYDELLSGLNDQERALCLRAKATADYVIERFNEEIITSLEVRKSRENNLEIKEYRLSVTIDVHDFNTRLNNSSKYLEKGHKIKVSIRFKGREMAHQELGKNVLLRFADALNEISVIEQKPTLDGRVMTMVLAPKKEK